MLTIKDLKVAFKTRRGDVQAVKGISFDLAKGERLGIVGESGSGKSVTSYALMRILDAGGRIKSGEAVYDGIDLKQAAERDMREIRGREISMIFQNPRAALNPIRKVGHQLEDVLRQHGRATRQNAKAKAIEALEAVKINEAAERYEAYPFELSGGMCQRVVIAIALACDPKLLIADEPTTGLDITTQKAVMDLVDDLVRAREMSSILITHDLGLASEYCDRIVVMKDGVIVEEGRLRTCFQTLDMPIPENWWTRRRGAEQHSFIAAGRSTRTAGRTDNRQLSDDGSRQPDQDLPGKSGPVYAVKGISFTIREGESVGLVGESGCGKSTTSSMIVRLLDPTSGHLLFRGEDIAKLPSENFSRHPLRQKIQMVFQDATDSLNPRHTARQSIAEPLKRLTGLKGAHLGERVEELAALTGLPSHLLDRFPHQLSGGQKARVGIARAIAPDPDLLILDEPTAALDVSIQAVVLNLLADLRARLGMSYLFVSHDLNVVRLLCDHVVVMKGGKVVEAGAVETVMDTPQNPYTRELLTLRPRHRRVKTAA